MWCCFSHLQRILIFTKHQYCQMPLCCAGLNSLEVQCFCLTLCRWVTKPSLHFLTDRHSDATHFGAVNPICLLQSYFQPFASPPSHPRPADLLKRGAAWLFVITAARGVRVWGLLWFHYKQESLQMSDDTTEILILRPPGDLWHSHIQL